MLHLKLPGVWRFILGNEKSKGPATSTVCDIPWQARLISQKPKLGQCCCSASVLGVGGAQSVTASLQEWFELNMNLCVFTKAK